MTANLHQPAAKPFTIYGFNELVTSVDDLDYFEEFFEAVAAWEVRHRGSVARQVLQSWQLPDHVSAQEVLMGNENEASGQLRLVKFSSHHPHFEQRYMRPDDQSWDTGGVFSVNIRVADLELTRKELHRWHWASYSAPNIYRFNDLASAEWVPRGPNGMRLSLVQRISPPLVDWPPFKKFSRMFNSSQSVKDIHAAAHFYHQVLGFEYHAKHRGPMPEAGPNPFGLPHNLAASIEHDMHILKPNGAKAWTDGSLELIAFPNLSGADFSGQSHFPNFGTGLVRLPVENIAALYQHCVAHKLRIIHPLSTLPLQPYGSGQSLIISSPDGAWLEFYQLD